MYTPSLLRLLDEEGMQKVHKGTAELLERAGVKFENEEACKIMKDAGARVEGKMVYIPLDMFEKSLADTPSTFTMCGLNEAESFVVGEGQTRTRTDPSFGPVFIRRDGEEKRAPKREDLIKFYKLHQASEFCDVAGGLPVDPVDMPAAGRHLHLLHEMVRHLDKPLRLFICNRKDFKEMCDLYELAAGKKGWLDNHVSFLLTVNSLSPMSYEGLSLESLINYAEKKQAICIQACAIAGFTAPMSLLGVTAMQNAEILAGNVLVQTVNPGTPFLFGATSSRPDMRTGAYTCASPDADLMNIPSIQVARELYHLPTRMMCGITDAKVTDAQAGLETMETMMIAALGGTNMLHGFGSMDGMNGTSFEKFLMAQEIFSRVTRLKAGISDDESDLCIDEIIETGAGGTYMMNEGTLARCANTWLPTVSTQSNYDMWHENGATTLSQRACTLAQEMLAEAPDTLLDKDKDNAIEAYIQKCGY